MPMTTFVCLTRVRRGSLQKILILFQLFFELSNTEFSWGDVDGDTFVHAINCAYAEVVHWTRNLFSVHSGAVGKEFVDESAKLFLAFAKRPALENVALKASTVLPLLLLQRP